MSPNVATPVFGAETEARLLAEFRRAAVEVPAYRTLLEEHGVRASDVCDLASFSRLAPLLSKRNTFDRFRLEEMSVGGTLVDVADVLTSSGHGGRFSFGVTTRKQAAASAAFMDRAFDDAFEIATRKTLAINCLPMGVVFSSNLMTVATTSVREDMAVALVEAFGHHYDQIVLVGDPLFMKRFTDYARERGIDWSRYRVNVIIGEEIFGPHFRGYLAASLGLNINRPADGYIMSSFGVGELGLHLLYETPATIRLRRAAVAHPAFAHDLFGAGAGTDGVLPMTFSFDPLRTFIEVDAADRDGYGRMTTSMLEAERLVPMLRYQTGDVVRLLDRAAVLAAARRHGVSLDSEMLPAALVALRGREKEALPNGSHVGVYKDALYADHRVARRLSGAFRVVFEGDCCTMHVQLTRGNAPHVSIEEAILRALPARVRPARLVLWPYGEFPFGMTLDYERKFVHYAPGGAAAVVAGAERPIPEYVL
jgi:phenylacetate-coenzyme A ligase PaaK-like adenylate-forming protein